VFQYRRKVVFPCFFWLARAVTKTVRYATQGLVFGRVSSIHRSFGWQSRKITSECFVFAAKKKALHAIHDFL
jgi:hypothetical protein